MNFKRLGPNAYFVRNIEYLVHAAQDYAPDCKTLSYDDEIFTTGPIRGKWPRIVFFTKDHKIVYAAASFTLAQMHDLYVEFQMEFDVASAKEAKKNGKGTQNS